MERQQELVCDLSNDAISNDSEWPLIPISRYSRLLFNILNNSKMVLEPYLQ